MSPLRICFAGTPSFAQAQLEALLGSRHEIAAVYSQPDRPAGRGRKSRPGAVAELALARGLCLLRPASLRGDEAAATLAAFAADVLVVAAYGLILPPWILKIPRYGCINVHASLLPRWRGAAPIERALLAGDRVSGVTIMRIDAGLDTGAIVHQREVPVAVEDDRDSLQAKLAAAGREALLFSLDRLPELLANAQPQREAAATYAHKLETADLLIDWCASADFINRQVRAGIGRSPAFTFSGQKRIRILRATVAADESSAPPAVQVPGTILTAAKDGLRIACGEQQVLRVTEVQLPGKKPVAVAAALNASRHPFAPGTRLLPASHI